MAARARRVGPAIRARDARSRGPADVAGALAGTEPGAQALVAARLRPLLPARQPRRAAPPPAPAARGRPRRPDLARVARRRVRPARARFRPTSSPTRAAGTSIQLVLTAHPTETTRRSVLLAHIRIQERARRAGRRARLPGRAARGRGADRRGGDAPLADRRGAPRPPPCLGRDPARALVLRAQPDLRRDRSVRRRGASACPARRARSRSARGSAATWTATPRPARRRSTRRSHAHASSRSARYRDEVRRSRSRSPRRDRSSPSPTSSTRSLQRDEQELPAYAAEIGARNELEPYRRKLSFMWWRLGNDGYRNAAELLDDLRADPAQPRGERRRARCRRTRRAARADGRDVRLPRREARHPPARARAVDRARARGGRRCRGGAAPSRRGGARHADRLGHELGRRRRCARSS